MNINETTTVDNSLLNLVRNSSNVIPRHALYERHRNALVAQLITQASDISLDVGTRIKAQKQLLAFTEDRNYTTLSDTFAEISLSKLIDIERLLSTDGMVMYGSRALNVNRDYSDYDLAFSYESHRFIYNYLRENNTPISDSTGYFTSAPEAGYHTFFKYAENGTKIDIIFVHNDEDLDVIRSSMQDLQSIPSYMLHDKLFRIEAYNKALQHRGWKSTTAIAPNVQGRTFYGARSSRVDNRGLNPWR